MSWFEFDQNNSGGSFDVDDKLCHRLFIEADDYDTAERIATHLGVYFNGVSQGIDCGCCGDRWSNYMPDELEFPMDYEPSTIFHNVEEYAQYMANNYGWTKPDARLFYKDGRVVEINSQPKVKS